MPVREAIHRSHEKAKQMQVSEGERGESDAL